MAEKESGYWFTTETGVHVHVGDGETPEQAINRRFREGKEYRQNTSYKDIISDAKKETATAAQEMQVTDSHLGKGKEYRQNTPYEELTKSDGSGTIKKPKEEKKIAVPEGKALREKILADSDGKMTVDEIVSDPIIQEAEKKFTVPSEEFTANINTPERDKLRHNIADQINARGSISGKNEFKGEVKKEFRAEIVIGAPAGGKSSVIVDKVSKNTGSRVLDSDEIKALLPEFDGGNGAGKVHTESADVILSGMVIPEYYKGGKFAGDNIVIPIVGKKPRSAREYLKGLKEAGYKVHLSFNDVTPLNSAKRATTRYIETGRFLSPDYIQKIGIQPQETYETLKKEGGFDTYSKYDNNVKFGQPAKKVERLDGKGNKINWEEWQ